MRILKKSLALFIALAMVLSLVTVFAAGETEKLELSFGEAVVVATGVDVDVDVPVYIQNTEETRFNVLNGKVTLTGTGVTFTGFELTKQVIEGVPEAYCPFVLEGATLTFNTNTNNILIDGQSNFAAMTEKTQVATAKFSVAADAAVGDYTVGFTMAAAGGLFNDAYGEPEYEIVTGSIVVMEEQWISSTETAEVGDIEYGASAPSMPATVKGIGVTSRGVDIDAADEPGVVLDVEWNEIDTLVAPEVGLSVEGTVTTEEDDILKYKNAEGAEIDAPVANATYNIVKSTEGIVADVEIDIEERFDGAASDVDAIVALEEVEAVTTTTIKLANADAEEETVTLNWAEAEVAVAGDTLDISDAGDSIVLNVPVTGETEYYDIDEAFAVVTITVQPAVKMYNEIKTVTVETVVEYGAESELALPETVTGTGLTVGGQGVTAENSDVFEVVWEEIPALQTPGEKTVNGTVAEPVSDVIKFMDIDYIEDVDSLPAVANYTVVKSTEGVVASVEAIEVAAKEGGVETDVDGLKVLEELTAVETTTIKLANEAAEEETVYLDWANAEIADEADTTLNLGSDEDSIVLNVPVIGDTTYYNLQGKFVAVTIQMIPAWVYGDVNGDTLINGNDLTALRKYLVGEVPTGFNENAANVYNPETTGINGADLTVMRRKLVDPEMILPVVE